MNSKCAENCDTFCANIWVFLLMSFANKTIVKSPKFAESVPSPWKSDYVYFHFGNTRLNIKY